MISNKIDIQQSSHQPSIHTASSLKLANQSFNTPVNKTKQEANKTLASANDLSITSKEPSKQSPSNENAINGQTSTTTNPLRLLVGQLVFLDINNSFRLLGRLKECLQLIDAKIADCLSKDVNYVITNRESTSQSQNNSLTPNDSDLRKKPKTSPNAINLLSRSKSVINRTQTILEKAFKGGHGACTSSPTDILTTARRLGIQVMYVSDLEKYIEKYMAKKRSIESNEKIGDLSGCAASVLAAGVDLQPGLLKKGFEKQSNNKIYKLKSPFLKFESVCKQYKPIYQEFKEWHDIDLTSIVKTSQSPFQTYFSDDIKYSTNNDCPSSQNQHIAENTNESQNTMNTSKLPVFKSPTSSSQVSSVNTTINNATLNTTLNNNNMNSAKSITSLANTSNIKANLCNAKNTSNINNLNLKPAKKKPTGYCECCKQRYENLKHHLTSVQHENFDKNQSNFKELDHYINGILNFNEFLKKKNLSMTHDESTSNITSSCSLDELKEFAKLFNRQRQALGLTQTQIVEQLKKSEHETNKERQNDTILNELNLTKFELLDITPRSGTKMKSRLEKWVENNKNFDKLKFGDRLNKQQEQIQSLNSPNVNANNMSDLSKKRKRLLQISFTPNIVQALNDAFKKNQQPSDEDYTRLAKSLNYDEDLIRIWFNDKQQAIRSCMKKFKKGNIDLQFSQLSNMSSQAADTTNEENEEFLSSPMPSSPKVALAKQSAQTPSKLSAQPATPNKAAHLVAINQKISELKKTPSKASSLSLSSPSAAVLFNLNSNNSFSISLSVLNETPSNKYNNTNNNRSMNTSGNSKLLASKIELMNSTTELQTIINDQKVNLAASMTNNTSLMGEGDNSTDLSCLDDAVLAAFINDFSYEIVQK